MSLSPLRSSPFGQLAVIGVPTAMMLLAFGPRQIPALVLAVALLGTATIGWSQPTQMWYIERGWAVLLAGGFVVSTALMPGRSVFEKSAFGVVFALFATGALVAMRPELFTHLDWHVAGQFDQWLAMYDFESMAGPAGEEMIRQTVAVAKVVYPAFIVLASMAALGVATYVVRRVEGREAALPAIRDFRFSDHFAWLLVLGLALLVLPMGVWALRAGGNLVTVMGGLYILRGAAVLVWLGASAIASGWSVAFWLFAALFLYPITIGTALVMGLSDTWLDLRSRLRVEEGE